MKPVTASCGTRVPLVLVASTVALPFWAVAWVSTPVGEAVLYREPKLAAILVLVPGLSAVLALRRPDLLPAAGRSLVTGAASLFTLLIGYMALTVLWVRVPENLAGELLQYLLLGVLVALLRAWATGTAAVSTAVTAGLVTASAGLTLIGLVQGFVELPWLPPIDPEAGARNPSLMGYKNPAAHAILGQLFLLAGWVLWPPRWLGGRGRAALATLLALEVFYLATLGSRTAWVASAAGGMALAFAAGLGVSRERRSARRLAWIGGVAVGAVVALILAVRFEPRLGGRLASLGELASRPRTFLDSDRGVYLRNTLAMVGRHPFGVGLGDWQTHYPVFRAVERDRAFTLDVQVRRAHSDHVQMLGELGWQGLAVWLAALAGTIAGALRRGLRERDRAASAAGVQLFAIGVAMATDYVLDLPTLKLAFFLVVFLALPAAPPACAPAWLERRPWRRGLGALAIVAAGACALLGLCHFAKARSSAAITLWHRELAQARGAGAGASSGDARVAEALAALAVHGRRFEALPGVGKTFFRDYLALAQASHLAGDAPGARRRVRRALELHPYSPNAWRLAAEIVEADAPRRAAQYREAARYILEEAGDGFARAEPPLPN